MKACVIDASLVLRSILEKDQQWFQTLEQLLNDQENKKIELWVPHLFFDEVTNGIRFSSQHDEDANAVLDFVLQLPVHIFTLEPQHRHRILELSFQSGTTVYDATYHFIAIVLEGCFFTADKKYYQKAKQLGFLELV